jgi:hypothetical protein
LRVVFQQHHVAPPQLYGAPAYARPPKPVALLERPFDPDDLPIELERTSEDRDFVDWIAARPSVPTMAAACNEDDHASDDREDRGGDRGSSGRLIRLSSPVSRIFRRE